MVLIIVYRYVRSIRCVFCSMTYIYSCCPFTGTSLHLTVTQVTVCAQPVLGGRGELIHLLCPITACVRGCQREAGGVSCVATQGVDASQSRPQEAVTQTHEIATKVQLIVKAKTLSICFFFKIFVLTCISKAFFLF